MQVTDERRQAALSAARTTLVSRHCGALRKLDFDGVVLIVDKLAASPSFRRRSARRS